MGLKRTTRAKSQQESARVNMSQPGLQGVELKEKGAENTYWEYG